MLNPELGQYPDVREKVLAIFESIRETPGAKYDPDKLTRYLIANTDRSRNLQHSSKGRRYFLKFIQRLQDDFGICFSSSDLEVLESLNKITARIACSQAARRSSLSVVASRIKAPLNTALIVVVMVLSLALTAILFYFFSWIGLLFVMVPMILTYLIIRRHRKDREYHLSLRERILKMKAQGTALLFLMPWCEALQMNMNK